MNKAKKNRFRELDRVDIDLTDRIIHHQRKVAVDDDVEYRQARIARVRITRDKVRARMVGMKKRVPC